MNNWAKRVRDLQAAGVRFTEIAEKIGISNSSVSDIANGRTKEPTGDAALALDRLHKDFCPKENRAYNATVAA